MILSLLVLVLAISSVRVVYCYTDNQVGLVIFILVLLLVTVVGNLAINNKP